MLCCATRRLQLSICSRPLLAPLTPLLWLAPCVLTCTSAAHPLCTGVPGFTQLQGTGLSGGSCRPRASWACLWCRRRKASQAGLVSALLQVSAEGQSCLLASYTAVPWSWCEPLAVSGGRARVTDSPHEGRARRPPTADPGRGSVLAGPIHTGSPL